MNIAIDARALFDAKVRRGIFAPAVKHLHTDVREERLQEGLGLTYEIFAAHAARGVVLDDALLVHSVRLRAQDLGRCVVRAGGPQRKRDVLDIRNYLAGTLEVLQLNDDCPALTVEAQNRSHAADEWIVSALDLESWLSSLPSRDREMLSLRFEGRTLHEIAGTVKSSTTAVFAKLKKLGRELADLINIHIADGAVEVAA